MREANLEPKVITEMVDEFVKSLPVSEDPYYQEAAVKFLIREFAWSVFDRFPNSKYEISEQLELMASAVKESKDE